MKLSFNNLTTTAMSLLTVLSVSNAEASFTSKIKTKAKLHTAKVEGYKSSISVSTVSKTINSNENTGRSQSEVPLGISISADHHVMKINNIQITRKLGIRYYGAPKKGENDMEFVSDFELAYIFHDTIRPTISGQIGFGQYTATKRRYGNYEEDEAVEGANAALIVGYSLGLKINDGKKNASPFFQYENQYNGMQGFTSSLLAGITYNF